MTTEPVEINSSKAQEWAGDMVRNEVFYCVSGLVSTLAQGNGEVSGDIGELCEEAMEVCTPTQDWESAGSDEGIEVREADDGSWQYSTKADRDEAAHFVPDTAGDESEDDRPDPWQELPHADDESQAWQVACEEESIEPYESEIYEHWIVSNWLARRLEENGERVGEVAGLKIWGRAATGQAISVDHLIQRIAIDMHKARE